MRTHDSIVLLFALMRKILIFFSFFLLFISCSKTPDCPLPIGEYKGTVILTNVSSCDTLNMVLEISSAEYIGGKNLYSDAFGSTYDYYLNGNLSINGICDLPLTRRGSYTGKQDDGTVTVGFWVDQPGNEIKGRGSYAQGRIVGDLSSLPSSYDEGEFELFH